MARDWKKTIKNSHAVCGGLAVLARYEAPIFPCVQAPRKKQSPYISVSCRDTTYCVSKNNGFASLGNGSVSRDSVVTSILLKGRYVLST